MKPPRQNLHWECDEINNLLFDNMSCILMDKYFYDFRYIWMILLSYHQETQLTSLDSKSISCRMASSVA